MGCVRTPFLERCRRFVSRTGGLYRSPGKDWQIAIASQETGLGDARKRRRARHRRGKGRTAIQRIKDGLSAFETANGVVVALGKCRSSSS